MKYQDQCDLAAKLARTLGADHEDPAHPQWCLSDSVCGIDISCRVEDRRVRFQLEVMPDLAQEVADVVANYARYERGIW